MTASYRNNGHNGNGNGNGHVHTRPNYRICDECKKTYYRSNRFRMWKFTTGSDNSELPKWQKVEVKLCTKCLNNRQVLNMVKTADLSSRAMRLIGFR